MAKYYVALEYGIYDGVLISYAEYCMLRKAGVLFDIIE